MAPLSKTALKLGYFAFNLTANPKSANPAAYPRTMRVSGLIRSWSMAYFAPMATPITRMAMPMVAIRFSPMNFSTLDLERGGRTGGGRCVPGFGGAGCSQTCFGRGGG